MFKKTNDKDIMEQAVRVGMERLTDAVTARRELDTAKPLDLRPSAESCVRTYIAWSGTSAAEHLAATRAELENAPHRFVEASQMLRSAVREVLERRFSRPTRDEARISYLSGGRDGLAGVKAELAPIGSNWYELLALAFQIAGERKPEIFGTVPVEDVERQLNEPKLKYDAAVIALQEIPRPLLLGVAYVAGVKIEPEHDVAERLIAHAMNTGGAR